MGLNSQKSQELITTAKQHRALWKAPLCFVLRKCHRGFLFCVYVYSLIKSPRVALRDYCVTSTRWSWKVTATITSVSWKKCCCWMSREWGVKPTDSSAQLRKLQSKFSCNSETNSWALEETSSDFAQCERVGSALIWCCSLLISHATSQPVLKGHCPAEAGCVGCLQNHKCQWFSRS